MKELINVAKILKKKDGITLIALVITIVVLLILAGVTIASLTGDNGLLTRASETKIETALGAVREALKLEQGEKIIDGITVTPETLLADGKVKRTVQQAEDGNYYMYYAIKEDVFNGMQGLGKGNIANLKDVFLIDDALHVRYIANNGKEYGDDIESKILEDETAIRFASKAFSEYVSKISGITEEEMKFKWMKEQTSLTITDTTVDSLEDLVFFPNLESLTLGENSSNTPNVTTMEGIENCSKLKTLIVRYGPDKDYSAVAKLSNLTYFYRMLGNDYDNIIDSIKFCKSLETLYIKNQKEINMSRISELNSSLKYLELTNNEITEIKGIDKMTRLETVNLGGNLITKIEGLQQLTNLRTLYLNNNNIEDITPLAANTSLLYLNLKGNTKIDGNRSNYTGNKLEALNKIGEILDREGTINLDIDKLKLFTNYKKLDVSLQNLTTLEPLEGLTQLTYLNLNSNQLTLEDTKSQEILKSMTNLETLYITNNYITNITAINNLNNLKYLQIYGGGNKVNLKEIEDIISNLTELRVSSENLKTIVNCDISKITKLPLTTSDLTELPDLTIFTKLTELNLNNNPNIYNFNNISKLTSLQTLILSYNDLHGRMIDFSKLTNLTSLNLSNNTLWSEDLENLKDLKNNTNLTINLSNNSIIDATALLELNPNTKIDLTGNINLSPDSKNKLKEHFGNNVTF